MIPCARRSSRLPAALSLLFMASAWAAEPLSLDGGLGQGVTVRAADDRFSLTTRLRVQARGNWTGGEDNTLGAEVRRMRLLFQGNFFGPAWQYYVQFGFSNGDTEADLRLPLRDAYVTWSGLRDVNVRFGQGKVPFNRQRVVSSSALQFVDRSRSNAEFNLDRDVGVQLLSNDLLGLGGRLAYNLGVFGGDGRNRTGPLNDGVLAVARLQWAPLGGFADLVEADIARDARPRLAFQVAGAWNRSTVRARSTFDATYALGPYDYAHANADVLFKWRGLSVHGEFLYREAVGTRRRVGPDGKTEISRSGWGYHAQVGYMVGERLELVGRVGEVVPLGELTGVKRAGEYGGGVNWYFQDHAFKLQADAFWLTGAIFRDGHPQVRLQAQVYL